MPATEKFMLETDFFPKIIHKDIYGFITEQNFLDIGTPERFKKAQTTLSLSFPNALVGNPDEATPGSPIKTFGDDNFGKKYKNKKGN